MSARGPVAALAEAARSARRNWRLFAGTPRLSLAQIDYDSYWKSKRASGMGALTLFQRARADWIAARVTPGRSVLDIGAGDGGVLQYLAGKRQLQPRAVDGSPYAVEYLRGRGIEASVLPLEQPGAVEQLPEADYILLLEVLEHLPDPERFLLGVAAKAREAVFVSVPNTGYFPYRWRLMLLGRFPVQWRQHPGEHLRFWTLKDFRWWLSELMPGAAADVHAYEGIPVLNRLWPNMFSMGIVARIRPRP